MSKNTFKNYSFILLTVLVFSACSNSGDQTSETKSNTTTLEENATKDPVTNKSTSFSQKEIEQAQKSIAEYKHQFTPTKEYEAYWCSIDILKNLSSQSMDQLELTTIAKFVATFHQGCEAEFLSQANPLLFKILENKPKHLMNILYKNSSLDKGLILENISNPLVDKVDFDNIMSKVESANSPEEMKKDFLMALNLGKALSR